MREAMNIKSKTEIPEKNKQKEKWKKVKYQTIT